MARNQHERCFRKFHAGLHQSRHGQLHRSHHSVYRRRIPSPAAGYRIPHPPAVQPDRPQTSGRLRHHAPRTDTPDAGTIPVLLSAGRARARESRAAARAQIPSRYRIGIATHRNLAFRSGRPLAVHAQYRPPVRFGNFIDDRSTARSGCLHPGRLRLPERPVQNIRGLDPGHRLLQLWSGKCEQSA